MMKLLGKVQLIKGQYIGAEIEASRLFLSKAASALEEIAGVHAGNWSRNQEIRDGDKYHMTVVNPIEFSKFKQNGESVDIPKNNSIEIDVIGFGTTSDGKSTTVYAVCRSHDASIIRKHNGLGKYNFHITIGFETKDVFSVPKDESTIFLVV